MPLVRIWSNPDSLASTQDVAGRCNKNVNSLPCQYMHRTDRLDYGQMWYNARMAPSWKSDPVSKQSQAEVYFARAPFDRGLKPPSHWIASPFGFHRIQLASELRMIYQCNNLWIDR